MIKMVQKQDIITLRRREMSLRAIARELKLNRATVTKVVREFEASQQAEDPGAALEDVLATKPSYKQRKDRPPRVLKDDVTGEIDRWLAENERRRSKGAGAKDKKALSRPWNGDLRHKKTSKTNPGGLERKTRLEL